MTRLACADTPEVENARAAYIIRHTPYCHYLDYHMGLYSSDALTPSFEAGLKVLEGALAIGRRADPLQPDEVASRMDEARARAPAPPVQPEAPFFAKVKSWLKMKETDPVA